jgi:hypothetical protein
MEKRGRRVALAADWRHIELPKEKREEKGLSLRLR